MGIYPLDMKKYTVFQFKILRLVSVSAKFWVSISVLGLNQKFGFGRTLVCQLVYDRNHLFGLRSDTKTETGNWPKLLADTETNRNHEILN